MRWLAALTLLIGCLLSWAIGTAVVIGRQHPASAALTRLHLTDCEAPCWMGLVPGITPRDDVQRRLEEVWGLTSASTGITETRPSAYFKLPGSSIHVELDVLKDVLDTTIIRSGNPSYGDMPTFGDLFSRFGPPSCVMSAEGISAHTLVYTDNAATPVMLVGVQARLHPTTPIRFVQFLADFKWPFSCQARDSIVVTGWKGLARLERYLLDR